jgi:PAS domain-containing protein
MTTLSLAGRWCIEPLSLKVTELYVNPAYCRMTGLPVEELLARVARRDMPERLCRLDHLCLFIDNLHAQIREEHLQYFRWKVMRASVAAL